MSLPLNNGAVALLPEAALAQAARAAQKANGHAAKTAVSTNGNHVDAYKVNGATNVSVPEAPPVDMLTQMATLEPCLEAVEAEIEAMISTPVKLISDIASHTLGAGGKRLRPSLTILCAQLCGDDPLNPHPHAVKCAAAVELTHTTTLLHDDVVDEASVRRGKPAANMVWGNETSVLVGDFLFAQVFVAASREGLVNTMLLPLAVATSEMCAGELMETQMRCDLEMSEEQYLEIIALKTAALTDCACRLGGLALEANDEAIERLGRYGNDVGMAFQIVDDVFDIVSTQHRIGKPVGNDVREGDITLPMLRAMQVCNEDERQILRAVIGQEPLDDDKVEQALNIIRASGGIEYSLAKAQEYVTSAKAQLEFFESSPAREMLLAIADYVLNRDK
ncbi:MAG TPA: polyprenyl synthetase family protein [Abditibacteriaceae bacterium]|jgi:geranylgeranyl pyrophosphate synthase